MTHASDRGSARDGSGAAFLLACVFLAALCFPGLLELPAGGSVALVWMLLSLPVWFEAARARRQSFDREACAATRVLLTSAGFLILWSLLSTFGTEAPLRASRYLATLVGAFALYFMIRGTITYGRLKLYLDIISVTLAFTCGLSIIGYSVDSLNELIFRGSDRAAGFFKNPNQFGMVISTVLPAMAALLIADRTHSYIRGACLLLLLLGLVASGSKTNLLISTGSFLCLLCAHSMIAYSGAKRIAMLGISIMTSGLLVAIGVAVLASLNPRALDILSAFLSQEGEVDSLMTRSFLWAYSLDQFLDHPLFGQGAGQQIDVFYRQADVSHSHNVLLDYARSLGAPGVLGIVVVLGAVLVVSASSLWTALRTDAGDPKGRLICVGLALGCLSYISANMLSDSFGPSTSPFFWILVYLSFAARRLMHPWSNAAVDRGSDRTSAH